MGIHLKYVLQNIITGDIRELVKIEFEFMLQQGMNSLWIMSYI